MDEGSPSRDRLPSEVARIVESPPESLAAEQFDALLGYYCVDCHARPACSASCDGFWFDDWAHLAAGGNTGPDNAERALARVVDRLSSVSMPPLQDSIARPLPDAPRQLMIDFLERVLSGTP